MSRLQECLDEMGERGHWWTTSELGSRLRCPTYAVYNALVRLHELGHVRRHDTADTWQRYPVREEILALLGREPRQEWTAHGVATELPHLNLTDMEAARVLTELMKGDYVEVWYGLPEVAS